MAQKKIQQNQLDPSIEFTDPNAVTGPATATDNAIARFDGTTGKLVQNSGATVDDTGKINAVDIFASDDIGGTYGYFDQISTFSSGDVSFTGGLNTNTISERTAAAGVTIDGVKLKDGGAVLRDANTTFIDDWTSGTNTYQFRQSGSESSTASTFYLPKTDGGANFTTGGASQVLVGTTASQALTNKTITAPVLSGTVTGTYTLGGTPTFPSTVVSTTGTQTLTNKRITPRVTSASASPVNVNISNHDFIYVTGGGAITVNVPTGTPTNGEVLTYVFEGTTSAMTLTWQTGISGTVTNVPQYARATVQFMYTPYTDGTPNWRQVGYWDSDRGVMAGRVLVSSSATTSSSSFTPSPYSYDMQSVTALAASMTINAPSSTYTYLNGQKIILRIKDNGTARTLTWNAIYRAIGVTLPTTTVASKTLYVGMIYNSADTKWDVIAVSQEA